MRIEKTSRTPLLSCAEFSSTLKKSLYISSSSTFILSLIEPVGQIVQRIGQKWLRPPLESNTPEVVLISGGRKYIRSKSLFLRRDHTCSCNFPGSVPDYIPYSKLLFNYNKGLSMPHGHYQAYQQSYLRIV